MYNRVAGQIIHYKSCVLQSTGQTKAKCGFRTNEPEDKFTTVYTEVTCRRCKR